MVFFGERKKAMGEKVVKRFIEMNGPTKTNRERNEEERGNGFQMPVHYPRYRRADYEQMPEWRLDCLLREYGLPVYGDVEEKRQLAIGTFTWDAN